MQVTQAIPRSHLEDLFAPDFFLWATGIEDTFITDPHRRTSRTLDEYELTQHYTQWRGDIDLIASLGVGHARYGLPWHRIEPTPGEFDFSWPDQVFERMLERGVHPIVDLMHYGTPAWLGGGFGNPDYPKRVSDYAARMADRYAGRIRWYTPLNEPRITAYYCGRIGWWPPYGKSWRGFVSVMASVCRGIVMTQNRLREIDPEIVCAHVDATDLYRPATDANRVEAELRQEIVFLALDLVSGRVTREHRLYKWLLNHGLSDTEINWFREHAIDLDVIGLNLYPMFTDKVVKSTARGTRITMQYGAGSIIDELATMYWERYKRPLFISETAANGRRRSRWMFDSFDAVRRVRTAGIPLVGYTWWPLFALIAWAYREEDLAFDKYLLQLGLFDLRLESDGLLRRVDTSLVADYQAAVGAGCGRVGILEAAK